MPDRDLDSVLSGKLERGEISVADADAVREFASFLREAGPMPGQPGADRERRLRALARYDPESVVDLLVKVLVDRDTAIAYAEKAKRWLIDAAGADVTDLLHSLDECTDRAERAEASLANYRRMYEEAEGEGDKVRGALGKVVELIHQREARYAATGRTTINAVPVADLRRALGIPR
jgi:hypothetical protein